MIIVLARIEARKDLPSDYAPRQAADERDRTGDAWLSRQQVIHSRRQAFEEGLHDLGYIDGQNITVEWRFTHDGPGGTFPELAADLVALPAQVIVSSTTPAIVAAAQATKSIPIVDGGPSRDLIDLDLAESHTRPRGNVAGTGSNLEVYGKLVDLLKEGVPQHPSYWVPAQSGYSG